MIFQEPMTSLSPVHTIGNQIEEAILLHKTNNKNEAHELAVDMLDRVGIPNPSQRIDEVSAPALRRSAPARHDRHGAVLQSRAADCG